MKHKNKKWFTLIELIITITIVTIISGISFISFSSYLVKSRDSKRSIDVASISSAIDIFAKKNSWAYPLPSESVIVTYNSWTENLPFSYLWKIKDNMNLDFNVIPKDPSSWDNYVFWLTKNKKYYQIWATLEQYSDLSYNILTNKTYADNDEYAYIYWNYKKNIDIWNYLSWLIILENTSWENLIPNKDINVWDLISWDLVLSWSITVIKNLSIDVPYHIINKTSTRIIEDSDFYISSEWTTVLCPNCSN